MNMDDSDDEVKPQTKSQVKKTKVAVVEAAAVKKVVVTER